MTVEIKTLSDLRFFDFAYTPNTNPVSLSYFSDTELGNGNENLNNVLVNTNTEEYPELDNRINSGNLTKVEFSEFLLSNSMSIAQFNALLITDLPVALNLLNTFFKTNLSGASVDFICKILDDPFGTIRDSIEGLVASIPDTISALKEAVMNAIDSIVESIKATIKNLYTSLENLFEKVDDLFKYLGDRIRELEDFFSDDNVSSIKERISEKIDKLVEQFDELTDDLIDLLTFRLCQMTTEIENELTQKISPVQSKIQEVEKVKTSYEEASSTAEATTIEGGRKIPEPTSKAIDVSYNLSKGNCEIYREAYGKPPTESPSIEYNKEIPNSTGTRWLGFNPQVINNPANPNGFKGIKTDVLVRANTLGEFLGHKLWINSGYRSPSYNRSVGGAPTSVHMSGLALDVSLSQSGFNPNSKDDLEFFIESAIKHGFRGIGVYNTFIHIDLGSKRAWNKRGDRIVNAYLNNYSRLGGGSIT